MKLRMLRITALVLGLTVSSSLAVAAQDDAVDPMAAAQFTAIVGSWDETGTRATFGATDPRADGMLTMELEELTIHGGTPDFVALEALAFRIQNDGGTWSGSGLATFGNERVWGPTVSTATLVGDGAYEGLTMLLYPGVEELDPYRGLIIPTADLPEPPALAPAD